MAKRSKPQSGSEDVVVAKEQYDEIRKERIKALKAQKRDIDRELRKLGHKKGKKKSKK